MTAWHFSRPELLWLLPLAALPLLIHLLNRHRARRQPFAAMDFLLRVQRLSRRRLLLRQLLLLLLRTLVLAGLVLAAAGPRRVSSTGAGQRPRRMTALVLDRSLSMRARRGDVSLFELARQRAERYIAAAGADERVCLLGAGLRNEVLLAPCSDRPAQLRARLEKLQPEWGGSDLVQAAREAAGVLGQQQAGPGWQSRVLLLTDGAAHALAAAEVSAWPAGVGVVVETVADERSRENLALSAAQAHPVGGEVVVNLQVLSHATRDAENLRLAVRELPQGRLLSSGFVNVVAGGQAGKRFTVRAAEQPRLAAVELSGADALAADDLRLLWLPARSGGRLLLVDGASAPGSLEDELYFLEHALRAGDTGILDYLVVTSEGFTVAALAQRQVVVLANVTGLDAAVVDALQSFVAAGGGLLVAAGDNLDVERDGALLDPLLPWPWRDIVALGPQDGTQKGLGLGRIDHEHPVLQAFSPEQLTALSRVRTWRALALEPGRARPGTRVLLEYENGTPALVEGRLGRGRLMLLTTSLDRDWNNWPTRASYLPFFRRLVTYLAGKLEQQRPPRVEVGQPLGLPWNEELERLELQAPDGRQHQLRASPSAGQVVFRATERPGWWTLNPVARPGVQAHYPLRGFFVDPPASESDLRPFAESQLTTRLGTTAILRGAGNGDRQDGEWGWWLLVLVALAVAGECFLLRK